MAESPACEGDARARALESALRGLSRFRGCEHLILQVQIERHKLLQQREGSESAVLSSERPEGVSPARGRTSEGAAATPSAQATRVLRIASEANRRTSMEESIAQARHEKFLAVGLYDANGHRRKPRAGQDRAGYHWRPASAPQQHETAPSNKSDDGRFCLQRCASHRTQLIQKALKKMTGARSMSLLRMQASQSRAGSIKLMNVFTGFELAILVPGAQ
ncbi:hypothetical protein T484DRAFT_1824513, partial [Baffinella frigidus]